MTNALCECGRIAKHQTGYSDRPGLIWQCCFCHCKAGLAPADWHPECMLASAQGRANDR